MSLFVRQESPRSELQIKIAAELQEKLRNATPTDPVSPAADAEGYAGHRTRVAGIVIAVLMIVLIFAVIWWASSHASLI